jgi:histidinol-phosphate aminotransferase
MPDQPASLDSSVLRLVRPDIRAMLGYEPIEPSSVLAERLGVPPERIVKLDGNENPFGPSPKVLEALGRFDAYEEYGDPEQRRLRQAIGAYVGVAPECVVAGHGSDEIIDLLVRALLLPGEGAIDCPPTFGMYGFSTRVQGGHSIEVTRRVDYTLDVDGIRGVGEAAKIIFVASPNNPTGNQLRRDELDALLALDVLVVVDEAYGEFSGESFASLVSARENLVVLRTFSKWAGLAGLRAGYGIMAPTLAGVLMSMKPPYTPNVAAEIAMLVSLDEREVLLERVQTLVEERERMRRALQALEFIDVYPSQANFLLCRLDGIDAHEVHKQLVAQGILVRYFDKAGLRDCLRISVGLPEDTDRVVDALRGIGDSRGR